MTTWNNLPRDIKRSIALYLDTPSLSFFARTNRDNLRAVLPLLIQKQETLLCPPNIKLIAVAGASFCYTPHALYACGSNDYGELGLGRKKKCDIFTQVKSLSGKIQQVTSYWLSSGSLTAAHTSQGLYISGPDASGPNGGIGLGRTKKGSFTKVEGLTGKIQQLSTGANSGHILILTDQKLYAFGENDYGQLGLGDTGDCNEPTEIETVPGKVLQIAVGGFHTLVLTDRGLYGCGDSLSLGLGEMKDEDGYKRNACSTLTKIVTPGNVLQIAAGMYHTVILTDQGLYGCSSSHDGGQLGLGHTNPCLTLTKIETPPGKVRQIAAGPEATLVLIEHELYGCGGNGMGQLGLGHTNLCLTLTKISLPGKVLQIASGAHTLALTDQGLYVSGANYSGQLGLGHKKECHTFTLVEHLPSEIEQLLFLYQQRDRRMEQLKKIAENEDNKPVVYLSKRRRYG